MTPEPWHRHLDQDWKRGYPHRVTIHGYDPKTHPRPARAGALAETNEDFGSWPDGRGGRVFGFMSASAARNFDKAWKAGLR